MAILRRIVADSSIEIRMACWDVQTPTAGPYAIRCVLQHCWRLSWIVTGLSRIAVMGSVVKPSPAACVKKTVVPVGPNVAMDSANQKRVLFPVLVIAHLQCAETLCAKLVRMPRPARKTARKVGRL